MRPNARAVLQAACVLGALAWTVSLVARAQIEDTFVDAAVSSARPSFPVLVFIPGGAQKALSYTALLEELTSRGYVIAALELPHNAQGMQFPDGTLLPRVAPADRGWEEGWVNPEAPKGDLT